MLLGGFAGGESRIQAESGRVVLVHHPQATRLYAPRPEAVRQMVEAGISTLWRSEDSASAWRSRIGPQEVVGFRIHSEPGTACGTRPAVVEALVRSLLSSGHPPSGIVVWDRALPSLRLAGYLEWEESLGIRVAAARESGYDPQSWYESSLLGTLTWGDSEFGRSGEGIGRRSYVARLLTERIDHIVNVSPLLNHNLGGVSGNLVGLALASVDNTLRFRQDGDSLAVAVPEIIALPEIGDRILLNVTDALLAQFRGQDRIRLQDTEVLNQLRFSTDPLALDVLSLLDLGRIREERGIEPAAPFLDLYGNAGLLQLGTLDLQEIRTERLDLLQ